MSVNYSEIVNGVVRGLDYDSTAMIYLIQDFIDDPINGYFGTDEETIYGPDGTTVIAVRTYNTEPLITVDDWIEANWETVLNSANVSNRTVIITDEKSPRWPVPNFDSLLDSDFDSGGIAFDSTSIVKYDLIDVQHVDVASVWCSDSTSNVYFSYSPNGIDWTYLKAEADHTLDSNGRLLEATNEADAVTNYWTMTEDPGNHNQAKFPLAVRARFVRMHFLSATTIYQLAYRYYIIPAQLVVDYLSALSADVGLLTAGVIQSTNFATGGTKLDLDNDALTVYDNNGNLRVKLGKL